MAINSDRLSFASVEAFFGDSAPLERFVSLPTTKGGRGDRGWVRGGPRGGCQVNCRFLKNDVT